MSRLISLARKAHGVPWKAEEIAEESGMSSVQRASRCELVSAPSGRNGNSRGVYCWAHPAENSAAAQSKYATYSLEGDAFSEMVCRRDFSAP
jgi:hypothetical protein